MRKFLSMIKCAVRRDCERQTLQLVRLGDRSRSHPDQDSARNGSVVKRIIDRLIRCPLIVSLGPSTTPAAVSTAYTNTCKRCPLDLCARPLVVVDQPLSPTARLCLSRTQLLLLSMRGFISCSIVPGCISHRSLFIHHVYWPASESHLLHLPLAAEIRKRH